MRHNTTYHQLLTDLGGTFRPQREWIEGQGLYLIVGHFLSGVGAGTWLFSLWFDFRPGLVISITLVGLSGIAHLAFLGRPSRFWMMFRLRTSWIARGFAGMNLFLPSAVLYLVYPSGSAGKLFLAISLVGCLILIAYKGNVYAASKGVPFWNSPVVPILYATYAIRGGLACLLLAIPLVGDVQQTHDMEMIELWVAISAALMLAFYLGVMRHTNLAASRSVIELIRGRVAVPFYLGTVGAGLVVPIVITALGVAGSLSSGILAFGAGLALIGDFFAKYAIAKAGVYTPLMPPGRA
jgi:formate-dependent nitrite reductase membrane component NrfD